MNVSKLSTILALTASLAASDAVAQLASTTAIRQPGAMTPVNAQPSAVPTAQPPVFGIQQPSAYAGNVAQPTMQPVAPAVAPAVQQPGVFAVAVAQPASPPAAPVVAVEQPAGAAIQQPGAFVASSAVPAATTPASTALLHQPTAIGPRAAAVPASDVPASNALIQQPSVVGPPTSAFASYYDDEDEESDDEADEEDDEDDSCANDVGCGDADCERESTCCGFTLGGWIQQGFTFNPYDPADGNNGTVILNDLANQYMMNQFWLYADREVDNGGCGWDWGGRFDVLFGTDAEYFQMVDGLEESWDQSGHYQLAVLRFYYDIAYNDWTFRIGRWDTPVGYEPFDATESFFYSRSYNFYAQPGSLLGMLLTRHLNDEWSVSAGLHRGDMQFDDTDGKDALGFIGGVSWDSADEESFFDAYIETDEEGPGVDATDYSLVYGTPMSECWDYVAEWYWGQNDQFGQQSDWYGLNQHFIREINDCWSYGFRFEWFRDDDGFIITDFLRGNSAQGPFDGNFFELTYAVNYRPCENFVLRPELRYDWFDASAPSPKPFDDNTENDQFLLSIDAIYAF